MPEKEPPLSPIGRQLHTLSSSDKAVRRRHRRRDNRLERLVHDVRSGKEITVERMEEVLSAREDADAALQRLLQLAQCTRDDVYARLLALQQKLRERGAEPSPSVFRPPKHPVGIAEVSPYSRHSAFAEDE